MRLPLFTLPSPRWMLGLFAVSAFLVPMLYAYKVNHIWEDYLITFRHSQNLCEGNGLVYQRGERVHGFTSPLGVLLPALGYQLTAQKSYLSALWMFRIFSSLAFAGAGVIFLQTLRKDGAPLRSILAMAAFFLLEVKAVEFTTDGMETGFMLFFFAGSFYLATVECRARWALTGLCWAGLMWTRPDGFVYVIALSCVTFLYSGKSWGEATRLLLKSSLVTTALYAPWLLWAWWYYGSPIPNTIIAKSALSPSWQALQYKEMILKTINFYRATARDLFGPFYVFDARDWPGWHGGYDWYFWILTLVCSLYWLVPIADRVGRAASLCFVVLTAYLAFIPIAFPWYFPPVLACGLLVLASGVVAYTRTVLTYRWAQVVVSVLVLAPIVYERAWLFHKIERCMRIQQREVENNIRTEVGKWLHEHAAKGDRVCLEPIGYIGYFSQMKILDVPGLVAPEVTRLIKTIGDCWTAGLTMRPEWFVLRPHEWDTLQKKGMGFRSNYSVVKVFDVRPSIRAVPNVPNRGFLLYDACFIICKKNTSCRPIPSRGLLMGSEAAEPYLGTGWETLDCPAKERWTVDKSAVVRFQAKPEHACRLTLNLRPYLCPGRCDGQQVRVSLNGTQLRTIELRGRKEEQFDISAERIQQENELVLELPNVQSVKLYGEKKDCRLLGVAVASLQLEQSTELVHHKASKADLPSEK
jgi:hypothetical protein